MVEGLKRVRQRGQSCGSRESQSKDSCSNSVTGLKPIRDGGRAIGGVRKVWGKMWARNEAPLDAFTTMVSEMLHAHSRD